MKITCSCAEKHGFSAAIHSNGKKGATTLTYDAERLGIAKGAVLTTGETFPDGTFTVSECEYRILFAGPKEFANLLRPVEPDWGYIIK